ncbi:BQ5605_C001g00956 [Microbotryum silenes-dioicae]|uniref:non-specific serine/threonine protein kinase n=1 Tax=Microbotryum silenes-dioicae TaxID=796604 RepID=A0A2X0P7G5_9BASI|nr:BQ5605_C001g00956 [Microbotryum silenes-dioicae]
MVASFQVKANAWIAPATPSVPHNFNTIAGSPSPTTPFVASAGAPTSKSRGSTTTAPFTAASVGHVVGVPSADRLGLGKNFFEQGEEGELRERDQREPKTVSGIQDRDAWVVSVVLARGGKSTSGLRRRTNDLEQKNLTIYVSTPTSSLTLRRSLADVAELEADALTFHIVQLRYNFPGRVPARPMPTPPLITFTPKKSRTAVFATLQRTLSPRRASSSSSSSARANSLDMSIMDVTELGNWLTDLSGDKVLRESSAFQTFFSASGPDDLESARLERRIKGNQSNVAKYIGPSSTKAKRGRLNVSEDSIPSAGTTSSEHVPLFPLPPIPSSKLDFNVNGKRKSSSGTDTLSTAGSEIEQGLPSGIVAERVEETIEEPESLPEVHAIPKSPEPSKATESPGASRPASVVETSGDAVATSSTQKKGKTLQRRRKDDKAVTIDSFEILRVLGKGCAGKVLLVRQKTDGALFALKAIHKQHVLAHRESAHTKTEQAVLKMCARDATINPFVVRLHYSFHDRETLYLALDFHPGGDLATQLARWGRLGRDRARFYTAEIVEGVQGLHANGIIYRDLKPENVLINAEGHIVLTDFGLSKDFGHATRDRSSRAGEDDDGLPRPRWLSSSGHGERRASASVANWPATRETTTTFCGTAEYLSPGEFGVKKMNMPVLLGEPYSYEVDAWSLGTMLWEMLAGVTPYWSEDHATMYHRVLHEDLNFDDTDRIFDDDTKSLLRGLLQRDPLLRMTDERVKRHPYFSMIVWEHIYHRRYVPPFIPTLNASDPCDTSQFDEMFLSMPNEVGTGAAPEEGSGRDSPDGEPESAVDEEGRDVFDGYSYYGRDAESFYSETSQIDEGGEEEEWVARPPSVGGSEAEETKSRVEAMVMNENQVEEPTSYDQDRDYRTSSLQEVTIQLDHVQLHDPSALAHTPEAVRPSFESGTSDSDWDVVDHEPAAPTSRNGGKEARSSTTTTLWGRGFKDKYRLVLMTPRGVGVGGGGGTSSPLRIPSGLATNSSRKGSSTTTGTTTTTGSRRSPSPTLEAIGRGRGRNGAAAGGGGGPDLLMLAALSRGAAAAAASGDGASIRKPKKAGVTLKKLGFNFRSHK